MEPGRGPTATASAVCIEPKDFPPKLLGPQLEHRLPIAELRRALVLGGLDRPERVLAELQARNDRTAAPKGRR
jgi:hypothetical protein